MHNFKPEMDFVWELGGGSFNFNGGKAKAAVGYIIHSFTFPVLKVFDFKSIFKYKFYFYKHPYILLIFKIKLIMVPSDGGRIPRDYW